MTRLEVIRVPERPIPSHLFFVPASLPSHKPLGGAAFLMYNES